jgi:hypothetical protein
MQTKKHDNEVREVRAERADHLLRTEAEAAIMLLTDGAFYAAHPSVQSRAASAVAKLRHGLRP